MTIKYLLPCSCGKKIPVETTQAGQDIQCSCGQQVSVPTMQGIRCLEQYLDSSDESKAGPSYGGAALGIALLGLLILGGGGALMYRTYNQRPVLVDVDYMSPWETWLMWQNLREGVRLPEYSESPYLEAERTYKQYMTIAAVIVGVGIVMLAWAVGTAILGRSGQRRKT